MMRGLMSTCRIFCLAPEGNVRLTVETEPILQPMKQHIAFLHRADGMRVVAVVADHPQGQGVLVRHDALAGNGGDHRRLHAFGQVDNFSTGLGMVRPPADDQNRARGLQLLLRDGRDRIGAAAETLGGLIFAIGFSVQRDLVGGFADDRLAGKARWRPGIPVATRNARAGFPI
jgi:hypothetical protein